MPPVPFHQLSDEPLYCEAVHDQDDDGFYSGSEDDHYEGPLQRRLRIERKAIDFLSGNVPILISAALRGPFDRKQWNNPWRSTRAESRSASCKTQPILSKQTAVPEDDLPDTQGTSLYPLPSPETTNPPSAKKNPYMDEQEYSRVKTWREAIKSTSASKDPFWQSQQGGKDEKFPTRKRSADSTWLHKRDLKKPRSAIQGNSSPDDSPSRCAARNKDGQTGQLHASRMVAHFLRNSSPPEDELATDGHTRPPGSNISPLATKAMGMTPHRAKWAAFKAPDTSDDELSLPATTPTSKVVRGSTVVPASSTGDRSPSRRKRAAKSKSRPPKGGRNSSRGRAKPKKPQVAQPSPSQGPSCDETGAGSHVAAQMVEAAPVSMDVSSQNVFTTQSEPLREQLLPDSTSTAKSMLLPQTLAALPSTQQDNSFLFHKRTGIPPVGIEGGKSPSVSKKRLTLSPSSLQLGATKMDEREDQSVPGDDPAASIVPGPATISKNSPQVERNPPIELPRVAGDPVFSPAVDEGGVSSHNQSDQQTQCTDETKTNDETEMADKSNAEVDPDASNDSAEVLQIRSANEQLVPEEPQPLPQGDDYSQSHSEWSTYLDTKDCTPASALGRKISKKSDDILVVEYGVDGASDPEWSTFINTQDITPVISNLEAAVNPKEVIDQQVGSNKTMFTNLQCLPPVFLEAADIANGTVQTASVSECSPGFAGHTGDTPGDSTPGNFLQDQMHSQASVGSIIDAYAEFSGLSNSSEPGTTEKPGAEHLETEAEVFALPCSLPSQSTTVPVDGTKVHNEIAAIENPQQLRAKLIKESDIAVSQLALTCDRTKSDEHPVCEDTRNIVKLPGPALQTPSAAVETASCRGGSSSLDESTASPEEVQLQSPWGQVATSPLKVTPQAPGNETRPGSHFDGLGKAAAQAQSPWNTKADTASPLFGPLMTCTSPAGSTPDLSVLAGKALAMSQQSQSPWEPKTPAAPNPPTQDFEMSIRAFSDFMSPSPVKKRASLNTTFPRSSTARPGILFKTPAQRRTDRHVRFAPLPGEQETCFTEVDPDESIAIYDEEEVSYFDPCGKKTGTMRMPKLMTRAASPPPMEMSSAEVGGLPDHDQKFAKHFEAMSKRKNPSRKPMRLLPSESQQTVPASQEIGAMAEAFIQASQTRKRGLELAAEKGAEAECGSDLVDKTCVPKSMGTFADQENVEPVDDVSLVLDNLDKFLDNTWGIDMSTGESPANDASSKHEKGLDPSQGAAQEAEDQMFDLEANVWAD